MRLNANIIRAAMCCVASESDVRFWLRGVIVEKNRVVGTNGHLLVTMEHGEENPILGTYRILKAIPVAAETIEFMIDSEVVRYFDSLGRLIGAGTFKSYEGKARPLDFDKVIQSNTIDGDTCDMPLINLSYLAIMAKMFKGRWFAAEIKSNGVDKAAMFKFNGEVNEKYGNPLFMIMPMTK